MMEIESIKAVDLISKNKIDLAGKAKDFANTTFWYYTSISSTSLILAGHSFWINNLKNMNDQAEANLHIDNAENIYALCFCNSSSEKIPLWYLYSGLSGRGASIGFTPSCMLNFLDAINVIRSVDTNEFYTKGKDFDMLPGWIYYRDSRNHINYRGKWYRVNDEDINVFECQNYFIKDYPWEYEKEFRVVIINKTKKKWGRIELVFPEEIRQKLKVKIAPELKKEEAISYISSFEGFKKYFSDKLLFSNLDINMSLYAKNKCEVLQFIERSLRENSSSFDVKKIYQIIEPYLRDS